MRQQGIGLALVLAAGAVSPGPQEVRTSDALYPCQPASTALRFFQVDTDEPDVAAARAALAELEAEITYGPRVASSRPGHAFLIVRAPAAASERKLAQALRKAGGKATELECVAFDGRTNGESGVNVGGLSLSSRDFVLGLSGDIAWYDSVGPWSQFYGTRGDLDGPEIAERYETLYAPYGGGVLGRVVDERFTWTLASVPETRAATRLIKAVEKLDGVREARLDGAALMLTVRLAGLLTAQAGGPVPEAAGEDLDAEGRAPPRVLWDHRALHALLVEAGLLEPAPDAGHGR